MRILLLEDSPDDADLLGLELAAAGLAFELHRVVGEAEFAAALQAFAPDIVVSDGNVPGFSYREAMALVREKLTAKLEDQEKTTSRSRSRDV